MIGFVNGKILWIGGGLSVSISGGEGSVWTEKLEFFAFFFVLFVCKAVMA